MSEIRFEEWLIETADFGRENPLPQFPTSELPAPPKIADNVPVEMARNMAYGRLAGILPYSLQDGYSRLRSAQAVKVAILENDLLIAAFLPEYGGRLWSLLHKTSGRELLYRNRVIQPGNLALRNAWFCGGVEWNIAATGHTPFTCAPLFTQGLTDQTGGSILQMYEFERWRGVTYQIKAWLPAQSPVLLVNIKIINSTERETPMYWWSNLAVPETEHTRVIIPAERAFQFDLERSGIQLIPTPTYQQVDYTYPWRTRHAADFFFDIPVDHRPYITALDEEGKGLFQTSTNLLRGRKLFFWGRGAGGKRWQEFLSPRGGEYFEIQAGLARTQLERIPMPARTTWSWTEAYGLLEANPLIVHGPDWGNTRREVESHLELLIPEATLDFFDKAISSESLSPSSHYFVTGSGWGALEKLRRESDGDNQKQEQTLGPDLSFPLESLTTDGEFWVDLLNGKNQIPTDPNLVPRGWMVQPEWIDLLEKKILEGSGSNWLAWYYLGVGRAGNGDRTGASEAFSTSNSLHVTAWSLRALAWLAWQDEKPDLAERLYRQALKALGNLEDSTVTPFLIIEIGEFMVKAYRPSAWLELVQDLPKKQRCVGRVRLLKAWADLQTGDFGAVENFFAEKIELPDLREGEGSLSDLWIALQSKKLAAELGVTEDQTLKNSVEVSHPVPKEFDFRMK